MDDPPPLQHTRVLTPHLARWLQPGLELGDLDAEVLKKTLTAIAPDRRSGSPYRTVRSPSNAVAPRDPVIVGRRTRERTECAARPSDIAVRHRAAAASGNAGNTTLRAFEALQMGLE